MENNDEKILAIDIGGSHIKAAVLDKEGNFAQPYERERTPDPSTPEKVIDLVKKLADRFTGYSRITAGFPGFIRDGVVMTAPKLGNDAWKNYPLARELAQRLGKPALVINDADLQGLSLASGHGLEMVITLGTGFGTALLQDGHLLPHLEMSQHPITKKKNYNDYIGEEALQKIGKERWNKRMREVIGILRTVFNFDHLYISGGNARLLDFEPGEDVSTAGNKEGIKGGAVIWKQKDGNPSGKVFL
jgi:polyphosphate glucokinase